jgi:hypothetical protein
LFDILFFERFFVCCWSNPYHSTHKPQRKKEGKKRWQFCDRSFMGSSWDICHRTSGCAFSATFVARITQFALGLLRYNTMQYNIFGMLVKWFMLCMLCLKIIHFAGLVSLLCSCHSAIVEFMAGAAITNSNNLKVFLASK